MFFWIIPIHLTNWVERNKQRKSGDLGSDALSGVALSFVCHSLKPFGSQTSTNHGSSWQWKLTSGTWSWGFHGQGISLVSSGVPCDLDDLNDLVPPGHRCS